MKDFPTQTNYLRVELPLAPAEQEVAVALLANEGYEAFEEQEEALQAWIPEASFSQEGLQTVCEMLGLEVERVEKEQILPRNWNAEWEAGYQPVQLQGFCEVIASFKTPSPDFAYTIRIDPKMSFGTGHHETTRLMMRHMKELSFAGKSVLDMGCGTGILAILAQMLGAEKVVGVDIDPWSRENTEENCRLNGLESIEVIQGDVSAIPDRTFDVILANINRNVLLQDVGAYAAHLKSGGLLLASGFLDRDAEQIEGAFRQAGLQPATSLQENEWLARIFIKA
jgi:ribosomal protein L11 methyltransferase